MRINYNISSIIARNALNNNDNRLSNSVQRLSSGLKINSAKDDAAGLAISRKMNAQIKGLEQANRNANDGVSVVNTADGAMGEMHDILQRMNELAIQSANGTNSDADRDQIQMEIDQLVQELDRIADTTQFNAQNLLDGSFAYKGYTNTENVKVMSYADGVTSGTYAIGQLTYTRYEDTITYTNSEKEVKNKERYEVSSADDVKNALITSDKLDNYAATGSTDGYKAFPDGAKVTLEDENIIIKAENDFEVKLTLNNRTRLTDIYTVSTPAYTTTDCYRNIVLVDQEDGTTRYTIKELNIEKPQVPATASVSAYYTSSKEVGLRDLITNDFAGKFEKKYPDCAIEIESADFTGDTFTLVVTATDKRTGNVVAQSDTVAFDLYQERNENGHTVNTDGTITDEDGHIVDENGQIIGSVTGATVTDGHTANGKDENGHKVSKTKLEDYLYSTTKTTQTTYTIGGNAGGTDADNISSCIELNLTGMGPMAIQVGANEGQVLEIEFPALNTVNLGVDNLDISSEDSATNAIDLIGKAINQLSSVRAKIGAYANRLERTITNLDTSEENMTAAYSRIMDVDVAKEMTEYTTVQVLVQSSTAMLAQANERPQQVLQLLQ